MIPSVKIASLENVKATAVDDTLASRIIAGVYPRSQYQFLNESALERVTDANWYYHFYNIDGQMWTYPKMDYRPTIMPVNLARWFVKKRSSWMFEVAPDIECPAESFDAPEKMEADGYVPSPKQKKANDSASAREQLLYSTWKQNRFEYKLIEAGKDHFIGGLVALRILYINGGIKLLFAPTQEVFPIPDVTDPYSFSTIHFCSYLDNEQTIWKQTWELLPGEDGNTYCYLTEGTYDTALHEKEMIHKQTNMGIDFIPVVLFPNDSLTGDPFGNSYLKDLIPLFEQYNHALSDAADSLKFNEFAIKVLLGASPDAEKNLKVAPGAVWNITGDSADAKVLESSFSYQTALADFLTRLENLTHMIGEVPDITPDRIKGFGLVSGVALKLLYSDLVSATQNSWRIWKDGLVLANEYILRMLETYESHPEITSYDTRIIPHLPLPENEAEKINMEVTKLGASLQSVHGALQELGEKYPERLIAQLITERERFAGVMGKTLTPQEKAIISGA